MPTYPPKPKPVKGFQFPFQKLITFIWAICFLFSCSGDKSKNDLKIANLKGKVKSVIEYQYEGVEKFGEIEPVDKNKFRRNTYLYNELGYLIEEDNETTIAPYEGTYNRPVLTEKSIYLYDKNNMKSETNVYDGKGLLKWMIKYKYGNDTKIIEENLFWGKGAENHKNDCIELVLGFMPISSYNGQKIVEDYKNDYNEGSLGFKTIYEYDKQEKKSSSYDTKKIVSKSVSLMDINGQEILDSVYYFCTKTFEGRELFIDSSEQLSSITKKQYDANNNVAKEIRYNGNKFQTGQITLLEYDINSNLIKDIDSTNNKSKVYKYEFDKYNNWVKKIVNHYSKPKNANDSLDNSMNDFFKEKDYIYVRAINYYD